MAITHPSVHPLGESSFCRGCPEDTMPAQAVVVAMESGGLLDVNLHRNPERYRGQRIAVVDVGGSVMLVPSVETDDHLFLKTFIPSPKATRDHLGGRREA
jgi:hypothetical protein